MKSITRFLVCLALLGLACSLPVVGGGQPTPPSTAAGQLTTTAPPQAGSASPAIASPITPRPPTQLPPVFPDCQPADVAPYQFNPNHFTPLPTPTGEPGLRTLAERRGLLFGGVAAASLLERPPFTALINQHFNLLAVGNEMKWEFIHPEPDHYDFRLGDAIVDFARTNGLQVYAHALAWDLQQPAWLLEAQHTREEWIQILCRHIKTVAGHYRGQVYAWDVVNEAIDASGELRDTHWLRAIGPEYIAMAFYWARQADPQARLIYNDFEAEGLNEKSDAIYNLVQGLQQQGIPIDGVGLQMHVWLWGPPTPVELRANMQRLAALGLQVHITEMDVRLQNTPDSPVQELDAQAETYRQALQACLDTRHPQGQPACQVFITWGLTDANSWIPEYTGHPDAPLLFDKNLQPKPAYWAIYEALR